MSPCWSAGRIRRSRRSRAVVGRTVNLASRVQDPTRAERTDIIVTEPVRARLDPRFRLRALSPTRVKGVDAELRVFCLEDAGEAGAPPP